MSYTRGSGRAGMIGLCVTLAILVAALGLGGVAASDGDALLGKYETGDREFNRYEIGSKIVYFHQRMIGDAIVEGDYIRYQFDKDTEELLDKEVHWRDDLPEHLPAVISKEEAESMVNGTIQSSRLYFISPESDVFPLEPTPQNPCWVVKSIADDNMAVTVIDGVEGKLLGPGVAPPYGGFSLTGPTDVAGCSGAWDAWYQNAENWFNAMGYPTEAVKYPTEAKIQSHVQSTETAMFYELAHGGWWYFDSSCTDSTFPTEIHDWIECYNPMPFTFIGSCEGMCQTGPNTFSYEFRKGSMVDTVTVGYCHMADPECDAAWANSISWQDALFDYMSQSQTVRQAFDNALADYPMCVGCMRFEGDINFAVVPVVQRGEWNQPPVADAGADQMVEQAYYQGADVILDGSGTTDDGCMECLTYTWTWAGGSATGVNPTVSLPLGPTTVTLSVDDGQYIDTDTVDIMVVDTTLPDVDAGPDVTVEQTSIDGAPAELPTPIVSDICDVDPMVFVSGTMDIYPLGDTVVTVTAIDASGNTASDTIVVHVIDTTPPDLECVEATNPHGQKTPAGKGKGMGQNPDGFYQLFTEDICDPNPVIYIGTAGDPYLFGPFENGVVVKITEDPSATPECKRMGGKDGAAGTVTYHIILPADPYVTVADFSGNEASCTTCLIPGEPM